MAKKSMILKQQAPAKFSTRKYNRCKLCGRPHAYLRDYGVCRICFRTLAYKGEIVDQADSTINFVDQALTQILAKETVTKPETRPHGCGVKYAPEAKKTN